uniref:ATP synthase epsilon chain, chloroplastic n=1 Tax=Solanum tuberosum TaxID=4113 RepID=M1DSC2_SOLTU
MVKNRRNFWSQIPLKETTKIAPHLRCPNENRYKTKQRDNEREEKKQIADGKKQENAEKERSTARKEGNTDGANHEGYEVTNEEQFEEGPLIYVLTPNRIVWDSEVEEIVLSTKNGQIGI